MGRVKETKRQAVLIGDATVLSIVVTVVLGTYLLVTYGPRPRLQASPNLSPGLFGLDEPTDRLVIALWFGVLAAAVLSELWPRFANKFAPIESLMGADESRSMATALVAALLLTSVMWNSSKGEINNWPSLSISEVLVGLVVVLAVYLAAGRDDSVAIAGNAVFLGLCATWIAPLLWQTQGGVTDPHHFAFTLDEILAPAAGKLPLAGYVPQYTTLLGFPIAPLVASFRSHAADIGIAWMLVMQAFCIGAPLMLLYRNGGKRIAGVLMFLLVTPVVALPGLSNLVYSQSSYFAGFPLRYALPVLLFTLFIGTPESANPERKSIREWSAHGVLVGLVSGAVVLNNPDFGAPAAAAIGLCLLVTDGTAVLRSRYVRLLVAGLPVVPIGYWILLQTGNREFDPGSWLLYQRIFGVSGYNNAAMSGMGLQGLFVSLFVVVSIVSVRVVRISQERSLGHLKRTAQLGLVAGTWGILTLPYFAGRSYTSTLIGGHAFQFGLSLACLISMLYQVRAIGSSTARSLMLTNRLLGIVCTIAVMFVGSCLLRLPGFTETWSHVTEPPHTFYGVENARYLEKMVRTVTSDKVVQISINSSLMDIATSVKSELVFNHPEAIGLAPDMIERQCRKLGRSDARYLVDRPSAAAWLMGERCGLFVRLSSQTVPIPGTDLVLFEFVR